MNKTLCRTCRIFLGFRSFLLLLAVAWHPAWSLDEPIASDFDTHIQRVIYNPNDVVAVHTYVTAGTHIFLSEDEEILPVASGYSKAWHMQKWKNHFFLKPKATDADTNLIIVTNKRNYAFKLILHKERSPKIAYRITFDYPDEIGARERERAKQNRIAGKIGSGDSGASGNASASVYSTSGGEVQNWNYTMHVGKESEDIAPKKTWDNGRFTYFTFPNNRDIPNVYVVAPDKSETMLNTHMENDTLVVQKSAKQFVLRLGNAVVGIYNDSYNPDGIPPKDGTNISGVKRVDRGATQ